MKFRIPTFIGILLVIALVGAVIFLFESYSRRPGQAGGSVSPANITVTNVTDTGFAVVWTTQNPATGVVKLISPKHTPSAFFDDRDTTGKLKSYSTHMVTIRSLTPATLYTFQILSNGKNFTTGVAKPLNVTTASTLSGGGTELEPAYGAINDVGGSPVSGAIVFVTLEQGQLLSTMTSPSGSWLLSLGFSRTASLDKYLGDRERIMETIRVIWGDQEATAITDTLNDGPVPTMVLGKTYDFRKQQAAVRETPAILGDQTTAKPSTFKTIALSTPAQNASLTTTLPLIQGTGIPGKTVSVVVGIASPVSGAATVGNDGIWRYTPTKPLGTGKQSVTATTTDDHGLPVAFTHTFTILKSGTQVLGDATPSATLAPTPIATSSASPSATPTPQLQGEPVPTSGTTLPTLLIILLGAGLLTSGFMIKWKYA